MLNARDARLVRTARAAERVVHRPERVGGGHVLPDVGVQLAVLEPGEPNSLYHWETETEAFFVISGEALLVVEGEERALRQWDFVYLPPKTDHVIVGAGEGPSVVLCMSSRENQQFGPYGEYPQNEVAAKHRASPKDAENPEPNWPESEPSPYRDGWLPG